MTQVISPWISPYDMRLSRMSGGRRAFGFVIVCSCSSLLRSNSSSSSNKSFSLFMDPNTTSTEANLSSSLRLIQNPIFWMWRIKFQYGNIYRLPVNDILQVNVHALVYQNICSRRLTRVARILNFRMQTHWGIWMPSMELSGWHYQVNRSMGTCLLFVDE